MVWVFVADAYSLVSINVLRFEREGIVVVDTKVESVELDEGAGIILLY